MSADAAAARATSDLHLVEQHGRWRLTIRNSDRLSTLLADGPADGTHLTVHVEPNLLPGEPFEVAVEVVGDGA